MKTQITIVALALCGAAAGAQAQESGGPTVSVGLRGWQTEWDTFSYHVDTGNGNSVDCTIFALPAIRTVRHTGAIACARTAGTLAIGNIVAGLARHGAIPSGTLVAIALGFAGRNR